MKEGMELLREYVALINQKRTRAAELGDIEDQIADLEQKCHDYMVENGVQNIAVDGYTVYQQRQVFPVKLVEDTTKIVDGLKLAGGKFAELVSEGYNSRQLGALISEIDREYQVDKDAEHSDKKEASAPEGFDDGPAGPNVLERTKLAPLPQALDGLLSIAQKFKLGTRKISK